MTPEGGPRPEWCVVLKTPATGHEQVLTRLGVGEALWLVGDREQAVRFWRLADAEGAAAEVRRARVGGTFLVVVIPEPPGSYRVGIFTPSTGRLEGLDEEGELAPYLESPPCASESAASELAALIRECRFQELYEVEVRPYSPPPAPLARPMSWWRRWLLRAGL